MIDPRDPNVEMIEFIAAALGPLTEQLVFVGGCAAGLLISDPARAAIRATNDVDLIAEVASVADYYPLTERMTNAGFSVDPEVICRWRYQGVKVDVMPTSEEILGFSNRWYEAAIRTAMNVQLPSGRAIRLISSPLLIATKIEAFYGRGQGDFQGSHDLEDIVAVIDGRPELYDEIQEAPEEVREYLREEIDTLLGNRAFVDSIPYHLRPDLASQARAPLIVERLLKIAGV
jgi:predicted nucleotidyltransferase